MGEAFSGSAELKVNVPAGTVLTMRYSQRVFGPDQRIGSLLRYPDGGIGAQRNGMIAPSFGSTGASPVGVAGGKAQSYTPADVYTARGGGEEIWRRRFGYSAFRYVELTGYPGTPPEDAVTGVVVHTDLAREGTFVSSSDPLNRIYNACVNSVLYCMHGFTQDNPAREKQFVAGFTANSAALASSFAPDSISYMWRKMIDASVLTQDPTGHLVPFFGFRENYEDPVTESGCIPLAYECWQRYGDDRPLRKNLDAFSAYFDYYFSNPQNRRDPGLHPKCETAAPDLSKGLLRGGMYAFDWYDDDTVVDLPSGQLPPRGARKLMWGTGVLLENLEMFLDMSRYAGRVDLVEKYGELPGRIREELNRKFYNPATGSYGCQGNDALALCAGVPSAEQRPAVVAALARDIEKRGGRFTTGTHGFPRLLNQLAENGCGQTAFELITREGYPGLLNQLDAGYGTLMETWNTFRSPHGEIGGVLQSERALMGGWFAEWLGGIRQDPRHPGFQNVILGPVFPPRLEFARTEVPSPYGKIVSAWKREGGTIRWNITVPWNTGATVKLPVCKSITVNGQPQSPGGFHLSSGTWTVVYEE
jgi:alpha-L-rhamnosidase